MIRVVAIDGPAASGKSSTASRVATAFNFLHLDSGALYRGVTRVALELPPPEDPIAVLRSAEARGLAFEVHQGRIRLSLDGGDAEPLIRSPEVTAAVSRVSALPAVRDWVNARLRQAAGLGRAVVVDGRDIGTAVFPDAPVKIYLVAEPEIRARRRLRQQGHQVDPGRLAQETARIATRDHADSTRAVAPLTPASDAVVIDTSGLGFEDQVARIVALVRESPLLGGGPGV